MELFLFPKLCWEKIPSFLKWIHVFKTTLLDMCETAIHHIYVRTNERRVISNLIQLEITLRSLVRTNELMNEE